MEARAATTTPGGNAQTKLLCVATLEFRSAPFRAKRLALAYMPAVPTVLDYGAKGYSFHRSDEDPDRFTHASFWENKQDFEQWWFSPGMQAIRAQITGLHALPLSPHWGTVLEQG